MQAFSTKLKTLARTSTSTSGRTSASSANRKRNSKKNLVYECEQCTCSSSGSIWSKHFFVIKYKTNGHVKYDTSGEIEFQVTDVMGLDDFRWNVGLIRRYHGQPDHVSSRIIWIKMNYPDNGTKSFSFRCWEVDSEAHQQGMAECEDATNIGLRFFPTVRACWFRWRRSVLGYTRSVSLETNLA